MVPFVRSMLFLIILGSGTACGGEESGSPAAGGHAGQGGGGAGLGHPGALLPCPAGELLQDDGSCLPPGVPEDGCGAGFTSSGDGGCDSVLPPAPCEAGQMAIPGEGQCREIAPCGSGPWGGIPLEPDNTIFVDDSASSGGDGSQGSPYQTIQAAVDNAPDDALIAVAAGSYGPTSVSTSVRIWGKCPAEVSLSQSAPFFAVEFLAGSSGAELHRVGLTGGGGILVLDGAEITAAEVWLHDLAERGLEVQADSTATLQHSLVEEASAVSVVAFGSSLTIEGCEIRDTVPDGNGDFGVGIAAYEDPGLRSMLTVRGSAIHDHRSVGIDLAGADGVIEDTAVLDTLPELSTNDWGRGIECFGDPANVAHVHLTVRGSVIERSFAHGIMVSDADLEMESTTIRDVEPFALSLEDGKGVQAQKQEGTRVPSVDIRKSLIERATSMGVITFGTNTVIEQVIARDTRADGLGEWGRGFESEHSDDGLPVDVRYAGLRVERCRDVGILVAGGAVELDSIDVHDIAARESVGDRGVGIVFLYDDFTETGVTGSLSRVAVEDARTAGLAVLGAEVSATDLIVRGIITSADTDEFGDAVAVSSFYQDLIPILRDTSFDLTRGTLEDSARAGLAIFAAHGSLQDSLLSCNTIHLNTETLQDRGAELVNGGGNECRCDEQIVECQVSSSGLNPPQMVPTF